MTNDTIQEHARRLMDGGPVYHETQLDNFIVEPWNAVSSLLYWVPVIYFVFYLYGRYKTYPFVSFIFLPLFFLGGTGSAIYHAFRAHPFFLYLDFVPIALLTVSLGVYLWKKVTGSYWIGIGIIVLSFIIRMIVFQTLGERHMTINISYFITGMVILIPLVFILIRTQYMGWKLIVATAVLFGISLFFRYWDQNQEQILPMGTHFLWHLFSAAGAWFVGKYLIRMRDTGV
ncbi:MAG: hypothetical protein K9I94_15200 [Bacteroidales bacterium]|nr:hypothetical protein [Bacteroidales bacterium]